MHGEYTEVVALPQFGEEQRAAAVAGTLENVAPSEDAILGSLIIHAGIAPASCDSCGQCGVISGKYRPLCLTWQSAEGPADGGLARVKVRTTFEGLPHACRGSCSRRSTRSWQHSGGSSVRHVRTGLEHCRGWRHSGRSWRTGLRSHPLCGMAALCCLTPVLCGGVVGIKCPCQSGR